MDKLVIDQGDRPHLPEVQAAIDDLRQGSKRSWQYKAAVSGSFRRHLSEVQAAMDELDRHRVRVLSPGGTVALGEERGFTFLATDPSLDIKETEDSHLGAIAKSDFLWVVCPDGQAGDSTLFEIAAAYAWDKPIFCLHELYDTCDGLTDARNLVTQVIDIPAALTLVERQRDELRKRLTLLPGFRIS